MMISIYCHNARYNETFVCECDGLVLNPYETAVQPLRNVFFFVSLSFLSAIKLGTSSSWASHHTTSSQPKQSTLTSIDHHIIFAQLHSFTLQQQRQHRTFQQLKLSKILRELLRISSQLQFTHSSVVFPKGLVLVHI